MSAKAAVLRGLSLLVLLVLCLSASQLAEKANEEYATPMGRGRAVYQMDHAQREAAEQTTRLIASLGIKRGDAVVDIGTGVGHLLPYLVTYVGSQGVVVGEDIFPEFLSVAEGKINTAGWQNVQTVLGTEQNPNLEQRRYDVALLVDTYHHLNYPIPMLRAIRIPLKARGRLIIVDYYRSRNHPRATDEDLQAHIRLDRDQVIGEVQTRGFHLLRQFDHLPNEYVLIFGASMSRP